MKIAYESWKPGADALRDVARAEQICLDYEAQGYDLTLRQLYYQFVARGWIPNTVRSYKRLGDIVNKGRLAGLLDWDHIVDRTRSLKSVGHWNSPAQIMRGAANSFRLDKWADQPTRVEVWVEKEALAGVIERVADLNDVPWFSCRGYVSQSELWGASQRIADYMLKGEGQNVVVLHLGDHDPSGIDMTRDINDRLMMFLSGHVSFPEEKLEVRRIALNADQVTLYSPPPNPTKLEDSRAKAYIAEHGMQSWELDALDPATLGALIQDHLDGIRDDELYAAQVADEDQHRAQLTEAAGRWAEVVDFLEES